MRQVMFDQYVNELRTYLSFSQMFFHHILRKKDNNTVTLPHSAQSKHAFLGKIKEMSKKKITSKKENYFRITTSKIRTQINQIIVSWGYC